MKMPWKPISILLILAGILCLLCAFIYQEETGTVQPISSIHLADLKEGTTVYMDELEVLERYAFQTIDEYNDVDTGYSDLTFYVYDGSKPMDHNELHSEYYIVMFRDKSGDPYITSMSVYAQDDAPSLNCPAKISACTWAGPVSAVDTFTNSNEEQLIQLRESALNEYAQEAQLPRAPVTLQYRSPSIEQYREDIERETLSSRITFGVLGVALVGVAVLFLRLHKKQKG